MRDTLAKSMVRLWRSGTLNLDDLAQAATIKVWAHVAFSEIDPDKAASIPSPKKPPHRDGDENIMRDQTICYRLGVLAGYGVSLRTASRVVADDFPMLSASGVCKVLARAKKRSAKRGQK